MKVKHLLQLDVLLKGISQESLATAPHMPGLERLLTIGRTLPQSEGGADTWLCRALGVPRQQDDPVAPFSAKGDGLVADDGYWLCADPVYFHLIRDRIVLLDGALPDVSESDASEIIATLNVHFPDMQFFAPHPRRWYIRLPAVQAMQTCPLEQAVGQDVNRVFPAGQDSKKWMVWLNELQMLLHEHPVNQARAAAGKLPVNSVWLWGGGILIPVPVIPYTRVWGSHALVSGITTANQLLPEHSEALWAGEAGRQLLILDVAEQGWNALEQQWFAPLGAALQRGKLARLNLHIAHGGRVSTCTVTQGDCWKRLYKFWMRGTGLQDFLRSQ